jgi:hypothetical protein
MKIGGLEVAVHPRVRISAILTRRLDFLVALSRWRVGNSGWVLYLPCYMPLLSQEAESACEGSKTGRCGEQSWKALSRTIL